MSHSSLSCLCGRCGSIIKQCRLQSGRTWLPNLLDVFGVRSSVQLDIALSAVALDSEGRAPLRERRTEDYTLRSLTPTFFRLADFPPWVKHDHVLRHMIVQSRARSQTVKTLYKQAAWLPKNAPFCRDGPLSDISGDMTGDLTDTEPHSAPGPSNELPHMLTTEMSNGAFHGDTSRRKQAHRIFEGSRLDATRPAHSKRALNGETTTGEEVHPNQGGSALDATRLENLIRSCDEAGLSQDIMGIQGGPPIVDHPINRLSARHRETLPGVWRNCLNWLSQLPSDPPSPRRESLSSHCTVSPPQPPSFRKPSGVAAQSPVVDEADNRDPGFGGFKESQKFGTEKRRSATESRRKRSRSRPMPPTPPSDQASKSNGDPVVQRSSRQRETARKRRHVEVDTPASTAMVASGDNSTALERETRPTHRYNLRKRPRIR